MSGSARRVSSGPTHRLRRQHQRHDRQVRRVEPREDRFLHFLRQVVADLRNLVANFLRRLLQILFELEEGDDDAVAVERVGLNLVHAADAGDTLFDAIDDLALDALGRGARVGHRDHDHWVLNVRELVGLEQRQRKDAEDT